MPASFPCDRPVAREITIPTPNSKPISSGRRSRTSRHCTVADPVEVALFARLAPGQRLKAQENVRQSQLLSRGSSPSLSTIIAPSIARFGKPVWQNDKLEILRTQDIMLALIRVGTLEVAEADRIKEIWAYHHRFEQKGGFIRGSTLTLAPIQQQESRSLDGTLIIEPSGRSVPKLRCSRPHQGKNGKIRLIAG